MFVSLQAICFSASWRGHGGTTRCTLSIQRSVKIVGCFWMEASTERHKSSPLKEQQMELLPFTALGQATHEEPWVKPWSEARHHEGCSNWNHFLRSWSESRSTWSSGKMSTAEATCSLRELLEPVSGKQRAEKLTVHGLKARFFGLPRRLFCSVSLLGGGEGLRNFQVIAFCGLSVSLKKKRNRSLLSPAFSFSSGCWPLAVPFLV